MDKFRLTLEWCDLHNLEWNRDKFTWSNNHGNGTSTKERLDRELTHAGKKFIMKFGLTHWLEGGRTINPW